MKLHGHTRLDLIRKGEVVYRIERDNTPRCPICDMELEITDNWSPIYGPSTAQDMCVLPFYVKEGITSFSAADTWERNHKEEVDQFKKQLHASMEKK